MIQEGFTPFVMMSGSIQTPERESTELTDQTTATSFKICPVGLGCFLQDEDLCKRQMGEILALCDQTNMIEAGVKLLWDSYRE